MGAYGSVWERTLRDVLVAVDADVVHCGHVAPVPRLRQRLGQLAPLREAQRRTETDTTSFGHTEPSSYFLVLLIIITILTDILKNNGDVKIQLRPCLGLTTQVRLCLRR